MWCLRVWVCVLLVVLPVCAYFCVYVCVFVCANLCVHVVEDLRSVIEYLRENAFYVSAIVGHSKGGNLVLLYGAKYQVSATHSLFLFLSLSLSLSLCLSHSCECQRSWGTVREGI